MTFRRLLIANRGEIAVRIARTASLMRIATVAVVAQDDTQAMHGVVAVERRTLPGEGPGVYLDHDAIIAAALETDCDAVHPGYGFLSEDGTFAEAVEAAGLIFVGPRPETLDRLGDKLAARRLAVSLGVPVAEGCNEPVTLEAAHTFMKQLPAGEGVMVKAVAGGGGRGIMPASTPDALDGAFAGACGEVQGDGPPEVFVERLIRNARHIEVQVLGDGSGAVAHLWDRDCSIQRRNQKIIEMAPATGLEATLRRNMRDGALRIAAEVKLRGVATVEFLVEPKAGRFSFLEVNPRLQVEHTVTEEIAGVDLVALQLRIASGAALSELGLPEAEAMVPDRWAVQLRLNAEMVGPDGQVFPAVGTLTRFDVPGGPGVRVDTGVRAGDHIGGRYDSLIAKLVVRSDSGGREGALTRARHALSELCIEGVATNARLLSAAIMDLANERAEVTTDFLRGVLARHPELAKQSDQAPEDSIVAPLTGLVSALHLDPGDRFAPGHEVALIEAMKMQYPITTSRGGVVEAVEARPGDTVEAGHPLLRVTWSDDDGDPQTADRDQGPLGALDALRVRKALLEDRARPDAVAKRHSQGKRTARENISDLCGANFVEYGALTIAAQRMRRSEEELIRKTPGDGMVAGIGRVAERDCLVFSYDPMVMAGTQALMNHKKLSRLLSVAADRKLPVVAYVEGGGGRPGDVDDGTRATGLDMPTFARFAALNTARIALVSGRCFAGNAVLAGASDIIIATRDASLGMAGPAMIEGAGLGQVAAEAIGPSAVQAENGVLDILVEDEAAATARARAVLGLLCGERAGTWTGPENDALRRAIPSDRRRAYNVRHVIEGMFDEDSIVELRGNFAPAMVTALARIEGRPIGVLANNPAHDAGAINAEGSRKAARFLSLCNRFGLPVVSLCDTPGFAVGPEVEATGLVRDAGAFFGVASRLDVPLVSIVLRRAYGLGAMAMTGGSFHVPRYIASWPSGEFGGMGPEGAVRLGYRKELDAVPDGAARQELFDQLLSEVYDRGRAERVAMALEIDAVIDPAESRHVIATSLGQW